MEVTKSWHSVSKESGCLEIVPGHKVFETDKTRKNSSLSALKFTRNKIVISCQKRLMFCWKWCVLWKLWFPNQVSGFPCFGTLHSSNASQPNASDLTLRPDYRRECSYPTAEHIFTISKKNAACQLELWFRHRHLPKPEKESVCEKHGTERSICGENCLEEQKSQRMLLRKATNEISRLHKEKRNHSGESEDETWTDVGTGKTGIALCHWFDKGQNRRFLLSSSQGYGKPVSSGLCS